MLCRLLREKSHQLSIQLWRLWVLIGLSAESECLAYSALILIGHLDHFLQGWGNITKGAEKNVRAGSLLFLVQRQLHLSVVTSFVPETWKSYWAPSQQGCFQFWQSGDCCHQWPLQWPQLHGLHSAVWVHPWQIPKHSQGWEQENLSMGRPTPSSRRFHQHQMGWCWW